MPSFATGKELAGLKGLLGRAGYGAGAITAPAWMPAIFNQGQSSSATSAAVNRAAQTMPGLRPNPQTDIGRRAGNELQYIGGQLLQGRMPYAKPAVGSIPPSANGESYRRAELRLGDAARSGGGGGGGGNAGYSVPAATSPGYSPAAERAYQQEVSRVAQLTAQDPELQRYEQARQKAVAAGPGSAAEQSAEDLGMQIWAQKYGKTLAPKVKPGQAGYDVIQRTLNAGQMGAPADLGAFTGAAPAGFLGSSGAPATSSYTGVTPVNLGMGAIGPNALTNAYNMQTASTFNKFMEGPTLSSQPLGAPTASTGEVPTYSQLSQPQSYGLGPIPGEEETFGSDASQKFANTYAKKLLNFQPI
jgi:hypothetical protein